MTIKWRDKWRDKNDNGKRLPAIMDTGLGKVWYKLASNEERAAYGLPQIGNLPTDDMIALYDNGMNVTSIARKFKCTVASVNLRLFGQRSMSMKFRTDIEADRVKELHDSGMSVKALAERFSCSETLIRRRLYDWKELHQEEEENGDTV